MSTMHLGVTISCNLHYFFSFIHFCSLYSHSGMAAVQKCWKYSVPTFQNRIKMEMYVSMWQTCHFHRPTHKQDLVNLRPLTLPGFTNFPHIQKITPCTRCQKDNMKQSPCTDPHFWMDLWTLLLPGALCSVYVNWHAFLYVRTKLP